MLLKLYLKRYRYLTDENVKLLVDRELIKALVVDLKGSRSVVCSCLQLTRFAITVFSDYLADGGALTILANHPRRFKDNPETQFAVKRSLHEQGAIVHWFRSPRLLHQKVILVAPNIVYLGSHNLSSKAFLSNHETSMRIIDKALYGRLIDRTLQFCGMV